MAEPLQINYRNPQFVDGDIFYIEEQQVIIDWFHQEAHNWTLLFKSLNTLPAGGKWVATNVELTFTNVADPSKFRATYIVNYVDTNPPKVNPNVAKLAALVFAPPMDRFPNPIRAQIYADIYLAWLLAGSDIGSAKSIWVFQWTPGMGDGVALGLASYDRLVESYIDTILVPAGIVKYVNG